MGTLTPLVMKYTEGRRARGEVSRSSARSDFLTLMGLSESFGDRAMSKFGPKAIDRWLAEHGDLAPATRRCYLSRVRTFCRWLVEKGHVPKDPTSHVKPIRQPRQNPVTFTRDETAQLFRHIENDLRAVAIFGLMFGCGCRCIEVARLQVQDYDPKAKQISLVGKAGHQRVIHVPLETARALDAYLDEVGRVGGPLIRSMRNPNQGIGARTLSDYFSGWCKDAGIKGRPRDGKSAHGGRRTAASDVMDRTGNIVLVQEMLGHRDAGITARHYLRRVSSAQLAEGMEGRTYREAG